jgi:L-ascorbate metabolism protein UlaG (beta-lactamase superfamily)
MERVPSSIFHSGRFHNPPGSVDFVPSRPPSVAQYFRDSRAKRHVPNAVTDPALRFECLPRLSEFANAGADGIFWIGHACFLICLDGAFFLIDPFFAQRAGPSLAGFTLGPKRLHGPAVMRSDLPPLAAILVSHSHYDHVCRADMRYFARLHQQSPPRVLCPLGLGKFVRSCGFPQAQVSEHDWKDVAVVGTVKLTCLPALHFSARSLTDRNKSLWVSWRLDGPAHSVHYLGDTAYGSRIFRAIGDALPPPDVALCPIGPWEARDFMGSVHCDPVDGAQLGADVRAKALFPMHYRCMRYDGATVRAQGPVLFRKRAQELGYALDAIWTQPEGTYRLLP